MADEINLVDVLKFAVEKKASDVHFKVGYPPVFRTGNGFLYLDLPEMNADHVKQVAHSVLASRNQAELELGSGDIDASFRIPSDDGNQQRFRVNVSHDMYGLFVAMRIVPDTIIPVENIGFHDREVYGQICSLKEGLVLVTGRTGSGKTTTLASLIQEINRTRQEHIITIEDPIEYVHNPDKCIISQREVGVHVDSFKNGLKYALRQDPNIILIGEIRDKETAHLTLEATATGHLVFATLHTMSAVESVRRYVNFFDTEEQNNIRNLLASNLAYVLSQQLIPHQRGIGRTMAMEVMNVRDSDSIKALLRDGKDYQIPSYMHQKLGMITMDERLKQLEAMGKIPAGSSIFYAHRPKDVAESYKK